MESNMPFSKKPNWEQTSNPLPAQWGEPTLNTPIPFAVPNVIQPSASTTKLPPEYHQPKNRKMLYAILFAVGILILIIIFVVTIYIFKNKIMKSAPASAPPTAPSAQNRDSNKLVELMERRRQMLQNTNPPPPPPQPKQAPAPARTQKPTEPVLENIKKDEEDAAITALLLKEIVSSAQVNDVSSTVESFGILKQNENDKEKFSFEEVKEPANLENVD